MAPKPLVLIFGEDPSDSSALMELIGAILPDGFAYNAKSIRKPPILRRDANLAKRQRMSDVLSSFARNLGTRASRVVVVAHRDCDAVEPAHLASSEELEGDLRDAGVEHPVAATPCWEIEAWWMLFPEALKAFRQCWREVDYSRRAVGSIPEAKKTLIRDLRPGNVNRRGKCRDYEENNGLAIARNIRLNRLATPDRLRSASLTRFKDRLLTEVGANQP